MGNRTKDIWNDDDGAGKAERGPAPSGGFRVFLALAAVLGMVAAYLLYFDSDYRRNMALVRADNEYLRQERDEAQAGLAAAQEELAQAQADLSAAQAKITYNKSAVNICGAMAEIPRSPA